MATGLPSQHISRQMVHRSYSDNDVVVRAWRSPRDNPLPPLPKEHTALHTSAPMNDGWISDKDKSRGVADEGAILKKSPLSRWKGLTGFFIRRDPSIQPYDGHLTLPTEVLCQRRSPLQRRETASPTTGTGTCHPRRLKTDRFLRRVSSTKQRGFRRRQTDQHMARDLNMRMGSSNIESRCLAAETPSDGTMRPMVVRNNRKQRDYSPLLSLEIPNFEMDRYSVMFEKILSPRVGPPRSSYYIHPSRSTQSLEIKCSSSNRQDPVEVPINARLLRQSLDVETSARSGYEHVGRPLDFTAHGMAENAPPTSHSSQIVSSKPNILSKSKCEPHPLRRSMTSQEVAIRSAQRPSLVASKSHGSYDFNFVAGTVSSDTKPACKNPCDIGNQSDDLDRQSGIRSLNRPVVQTSSPDPDSPARLGQRHVHLPSLGEDNTSRAPTAEEEPALSRFIRTHGTARVAAADGEVSVARQVSITRKQKAGAPIPVRQSARQPVHVKVVNVCGTPAKRKSHHLTLVEV